MRNYIRHPADIPIEIQPACLEDSSSVQMQNISYGGLSIYSDIAYDAGSQIVIRITSVNPAFEAQTKVTWCKRVKAGYIVGLEFINQKDVYKARMVEQVCHIQHYRNVVLREQGRELAHSEAAREWVMRYAESFPNPEEDE